MYEVELIEEAEADFAALDPSLRRQAEAQMRKLKQHPYAGKPLGHKAGYDLTGYRAIPFAGKRYRIVYKVDEESELVTVIVIAKKAKFEAYQLAAWRAGEEE
ncbi:MAG: addiction module toxin RelE [Anaerolineales bacterium]|nr:MAG: addiction module toxin RelE [Anaerolineales bacterium]